MLGLKEWVVGLIGREKVSCQDLTYPHLLLIVTKTKSPLFGLTFKCNNLGNPHQFRDLEVACYCSNVTQTLVGLCFNDYLQVFFTDLSTGFVDN